MTARNNNVLIWQGNEITRARYNYTAHEINLMTMIFETINRHGKNDYVTYSFSLSEFFQLSGISENNLFHIKKAFRELQIKIFEFYDPNNSNLYYQVPLISGIRIDTEKKIVYFNIDPFIKPLLVECGKHTTRYYRESIFALPGKNSKRIYHYCTMWKNSGICIINLDELKYKLELDKSYESNSMFCEKVLDVAMKEINGDEKHQGTDLQVSYELKKNAKKLWDVIFYIKIRNQVDYNTYPQFKTLKEEMKLASWQCDNVFKTLTREQIATVILQIRENSNTIKNKGAYIWNIFTKMGVPEKQI